MPLTVRLRTLGSSALDGREAMPLAVRRIAPGPQKASTSGRRSTASGPNNAVSSASLEGRDGKCGMDASGAGGGARVCLGYVSHVLGMAALIGKLLKEQGLRQGVFDHGRGKAIGGR